MMKLYQEMNAREKIIHDHGGTQLTDDVNHPVRRYFRCWLDGSYNGEQNYRRNCDFVRRNHNNHSIMRQFVVSEFCQYVAREYDISTEYAKTCVSESMSSSRFLLLTDQLVDDALDLVDFEEE